MSAGDGARLRRHHAWRGGAEVIVGSSCASRIATPRSLF
jgi:hypothetical protein